MTDEVEKRARLELQRTDPADAYIAAEELAEDVLTMLPVVRAAVHLRNMRALAHAEFEVEYARARFALDEAVDAFAKEMT